jgi:DNA-directed RNA polymerase III subunit RPC3
VLIQQHLVFHYTSLDDGVTYYEADWRAAYRLVRSGKIVELVRQRLGGYAAMVMSTVLLLGHAEISYLEALPELMPDDRPKHPGKQQVNGVNSTHAPIPANTNSSHYQSRPAQLHPTLRSLAAHGYIMRVRDAQFRSHADNLLDAERMVKAEGDIRHLKGKKLQEAVEEGIERLVRERTDGSISHSLLHNGIPRGIKRRLADTDTATPNKRAKLQYTVDDEEDGFSDDGDDLDDTVRMDVRCS